MYALRAFTGLENLLQMALQLIETGDYATLGVADSNHPAGRPRVATSRVCEGTTWCYVLFSTPRKKQVGNALQSRRHP